MRYIVIKMTRAQALRADLLVCKCGHRPNNHFSFKTKPCAHCKCREYREKPRIGRQVPDYKLTCE